jgi:hypothetical protein
MLVILIELFSHPVGEHSFLGPAGVLYSYILFFFRGEGGCKMKLCWIIRYNLKLDSITTGVQYFLVV